MGWIISLVMIAVCVLSGYSLDSIDSMLIAAGLFAIAGAIDVVASKLRAITVKEEDEEY